MTHKTKKSNDVIFFCLGIFATAALDYFLNNPGTIDEKALEEAAGIGVKVTPDQIEDAVRQIYVWMG